MSLAVAEWIYARRYLLSSAILAVSALLLTQINLVELDNTFTAWFAGDDPVYAEYERFRQDFDGTRTLIVAIEAPTREALFSRDGFDYLERVTRVIEDVDAVARVTSLATAAVVDGRPSEDPSEAPTLRVRSLLDDLWTDTPAAVGQRAVDDPLLRDDLVSADGTVAAIIVAFDEDEIDLVRSAVLATIRSAVEDGRPAGFTAYYNGPIEITDAYDRITVENQMWYSPAVFLMMMAAVFLLYRSWAKTLVTASAVLLSVVWTLGLYGLLGFRFNVISSMIIALTIVLAIADDVHVVQHYVERRRRGSAKDAFVGTIARLLGPIAGATATTALGLLSLATSDVIAVRDLGIGAAIGVTADFLLSMVLVPTMLGWLPPEPKLVPQEAWFARPMRAVAGLASGRAPVVLGAAVAVALIASVGLTRLRVETNHISFFGEQHPLGRSASLIDERLGGIYTFQILLEGPAESLREPGVLRRMQELEAALGRLGSVRKVNGLADYVARVHEEIGDGSGTAGLPDDASLIAQELFVFGLADEGREELARIVASDYSVSQITVKHTAISSDRLLDLIGQAEALSADAFADTPVRATVTGFGRLSATLDRYLVDSQVTSLSTAFVAVFGVMMLVFRSVRFGLLAILPNLFPVLAVFGFMGWVGISLNVATVMVASIALGVVDDDTVHFIGRYRREVASGRSGRQAILAATETEGRAALTSAIINALAFSVLMLSEYRPTAWFGGLLALTMAIAFFAEVFILPAMITVLPRFFGAEQLRALAGHRVWSRV